MKLLLIALAILSYGCTSSIRRNDLIRTTKTTTETRIYCPVGSIYQSGLCRVAFKPSNRHVRKSLVKRHTMNKAIDCKAVMAQINVCSGESL